MEAAASLGMDAGMQRPVPPPSMEEVQRLHQELNTWMSHTRYQLQAADYKPIWRVQNTALTLSTGAGLGAYVAVRRFRPGTKFPFDLIPAFVMYYFSHRIAHSVQSPGLYYSILNLESPMGSKARDILGAMRSGKPLPSTEFEKQRVPVRPPQGQPGREVPFPEPAGFTLPDNDAPASISAADGVKGGVDPWVGGGIDSMEAGNSSWGAHPPAPERAGTPGEAAPRPRRTWEEIRAQAAAQQGPQHR